MTSEELDLYMNNPSRIINRVISDVEQANADKGFTITGKGHPFSYAIDMIVASSYNLLNRSSDGFANVYSVHARNVKNLSRNMSDDEWWGMFAVPSSTVMQYAISENDIKKLAVPYTEVSGNTTSNYRKLVIPKDTEIDVYGVRFAIETAIEIRLMDNGSYQTVYDLNNTSPFNTISNNLLDKEVTTRNGVTYLFITIPVRQLACTVKRGLGSTLASGLPKDTFTYTDRLYAIRAFITRASDGQTEEMSVSYDAATFDPFKATLTVDLDTSTNSFTYTIPEVYINSGLGVGKVTLMVYTTLGVQEKNISEIGAENFNPIYMDNRYDKDRLDAYATPIRGVEVSAWKCIESITGGVNNRSFDSIRQSRIYGAKVDNSPISDKQLAFTLSQYGYDNVKAIDFVSGKLYQTTRELPVQDNKSFSSAMGCYLGSTLQTIEELVASGTVYDNGQRITIPPNTLYDVTTGSTRLVTQLNKDKYLTSTNDEKINLINNNTFVYNPFYNVIDTTENQILSRTYHLDDPTIQYQLYEFENTRLAIDVGVGSVNMRQDANGYYLELVTKSGESYKALADDAIGMQLSFTPFGSNTPAAMAATLVGNTAENERVYRFTIPSQYDVDVNDNLYLDGFNQFGNLNNHLPTNLVQEFTLLFVMQGGTGAEKTDSDLKIDSTVFTGNWLAITESSYRLKFGERLGNLFTRVRPLVGEAQYKKWDIDVPATYEKNELKRVNGEIVFDTNGDPILEHRAGDIVYNENGSIRYLHLATDLVYENDKPVKLAPRKLKYHFDFVTFDAAYFFSTDSFDKTFALDTKNYFVNIIMRDIKAFQARCIEETVLLFKPKSKLGVDNVIINAKFSTKVRKDLRFSIIYYLDKVGIKDVNLQAALKLAAPVAINEVLLKPTFSSDDLTKALRSANTVGVRVNALADDIEIDVISSTDLTSGFSVKKILQANSDGLLSVREDIEVDFRLHNDQ